MKKSILILGCALLLVGQALAQDAPAMFAIYQDQVMPSKDVQYREGIKKLKAACEQNKIDVRWNSFSIEDNSYVHSVPVKSFADLDKNPFATLESKIGKETLAGIWSGMDQCIESQNASIIVTMPNHSYLASTPEDAFRDITYWYILPSKETEAEKIIAEWKQLHEAKNTNHGFSTYKVIFGGERGYVIISWGKTLQDWAGKRQKANELMGEEGGKLWAKTLTVTRKLNSKRGWFSKDFSYSPPAPTTTK